LYGFMNPREMGFSRLPDPELADVLLEYDVTMNYTDRDRKEQIRVWYRVVDRVHIYLLEAQRFQEKRSVYTYTREEFQLQSWKTPGTGHYDYFAMNLLLQKGGLDLIMILGEHPQIIHCHDGHTAVTPAMMRECPGYKHYFRTTAALVTIHNGGIGYHQEVSDLPFVQAITGLPWAVVNDSCLDHSFDPFIAASRYGLLSTVSENYARELQETDSDYLTGWLGHRLKDDGVAIAGVTNGIDPDDFNTGAPGRLGIAASYDVRDEDDDLAGKTACKQEILRMLGERPLDPDGERAGYLTNAMSWPLYTFIGRLSDQKGIDILTEAISMFLAEEPEAQILCLGNGGEREEAELVRTAYDQNTVGRICFLKGFDSGLANKVYAAGDFFIIPSRYEPCGLTDYIAQLFGNLPIVHHVGGLVKVVDAETGFVYHDNSPENLCRVMHRAAGVYRDKKLMRTMQKAAVETIDHYYTWNKVMKHYIVLYKKALSELSVNAR
ncbi:MAG: glycogen/starch synthase, partial [Desulfocapsaceae bacterium]|nr:glycogen/starch synthase [Desulfocapsaceae bacterium]